MKWCETNEHKVCILKDQAREKTSYKMFFYYIEAKDNLS